MTSAVLLKVAAVWLVAFATLNLSARAVGTSQAADPALNGFYVGCENQPIPCWYGILPGITTKETTRAILTELGYSGTDSASGFLMNFTTTASNVPQSVFVGYSAGGDEGRIASLELSQSNLTVGEVVSALGYPAALRFDRLLATLYLDYARPDTGYITHVTIRAQKLSAYTETDFISLTRTGQRRRDAAQWHGFAPIWRYCQIQPEYFGCKR